MEFWNELSNFESFLAAHGLLAIFIVMLLKELGAPVPVPSDLIVIAGSIQAALGDFNVVEFLLVLEITVLIGGSFQFLVARGLGRPIVYRCSRFFGLTVHRLDEATARLQKAGPVALFLGLNVPVARAAIVPAAGLSRLTYRTFVLSLIGGNTLFFGWHIALGYLIGPAAEELEPFDFPLVILATGLVALGAIIWLLRRGGAKNQGTSRNAVQNLAHRDASRARASGPGGPLP